MDEFEKIAADLEKSIKIDEAAAPLSAEQQELLKDPANVRKALALGMAELAKAKGAQTTDLSQEKKVKDDNVTDDEDEGDEGPKAVPSGKGYKDTRPYVGKMGKGESCDDDDGDGDEGKPSFFGKKKGKGKMDKGAKVKKSDDDDGDDELVDVTEQIAQMAEHNESVAKCLNFLVDKVCKLEKSQDELTEGSAIFGQVLHQVAENDPRRDNLTVTMAKALHKALGELSDLKKSLGESRDLMKSVATMPGAPRVAGLALAKAEADAASVDPGVKGPEISKGDKSRLYKAAVQKDITFDEYTHAVKTGDVSVLTKVAAR